MNEYKQKATVVYCLLPELTNRKDDGPYTQNEGLGTALHHRNLTL